MLVRLGLWLGSGLEIWFTHLPGSYIMPGMQACFAPCLAAATPCQQLFRQRICLAMHCWVALAAPSSRLPQRAGGVESLARQAGRRLHGGGRHGGRWQQQRQGHGAAGLILTLTLTLTLNPNPNLTLT